MRIDLMPFSMVSRSDVIADESLRMKGGKQVSTWEGKGYILENNKKTKSWLQREISNVPNFAKKPWVMFIFQVSEVQKSVEYC